MCPTSLYDQDDIIGTPAIDNARTIDVRAEKNSCKTFPLLDGLIATTTSSLGVLKVLSQ